MNFTPETVISYLMIAAAAGGFSAQMLMGVVTFIRIRSVIDIRLKPVTVAIQALEIRLEALEGFVTDIRKRTEL